MTSIADAVAQINSTQTPVIILDTCTLLDLFRRDERTHQPRVPSTEIRAAAQLREYATAQPPLILIVVPELVPGEYAEHADRIEQGFSRWLEFHDQNQTWLEDATPSVGLALPSPMLVRQFEIQRLLRQLADEILANSIVLDRDRSCVDRALSRLTSKRRPSHHNEVKDSMNLEQAFELSRQLSSSGVVRSRVFVSSNTQDFAETATGSQVHPDLRPDFIANALEYFTSLRAAVGQLRARGELP